MARADVAGDLGDHGPDVTQPNAGGAVDHDPDSLPPETFLDRTRAHLLEEARILKTAQERRVPKRAAPWRRDPPLPQSWSAGRPR